jgi:hypothetical protein
VYALQNVFNAPPSIFNWQNNLFNAPARLKNNGTGLKQPLIAVYLFTFQQQTW